jgi:apolipoprotein N-acyltransferase
LTFITVAVLASPAALADDRSDTAWPWLSVLLAFVAIAALALFGSLRLSRMPTTWVDGVALRIMQPNLQQDSKFNYSAKAQVMSQYIALSSRESDLRPRGLREVTHLIWPESAFPFYLTTEPDALAQIASLLPEGTVLITGADRVGAPPPSTASTDTRTSIYVIDHHGSVLGLYDKVHLVPFGEFLPFQNLLERLGLVQLTKLAGGLFAGEHRHPMAIPRAPPAFPLLCYEVIFPSETAAREERAGWLLNLTNDGWFGGPYQHFEQARLRAIEQGLPLVRAANTGISAVVDPLGRVIRSLPLGVEGLLDAPLPQAIAPTLYARFGDGLAGLLLAVALIMVLRRRIWDWTVGHRDISRHDCTVPPAACERPQRSVRKSPGLLALVGSSRSTDESFWVNGSHDQQGRSQSFALGCGSRRGEGWPDRWSFGGVEKSSERKRRCTRKADLRSRCREDGVRCWLMPVPPQNLIRRATRTESSDSSSPRERHAKPREVHGRPPSHRSLHAGFRRSADGRRQEVIHGLCCGFESLDRQVGWESKWRPRSYERSQGDR